MRLQESVLTHTESTDRLTGDTGSGKKNICVKGFGNPGTIMSTFQNDNKKMIINLLWTMTLYSAMFRSFAPITFAT